MAQENIINGFDFGSLPIVVTYCGKITEGKGGWDHFLYSVSIGKGKNMFTTSYKCGLGHVIKSKVKYIEDKPKKPSNSDIIYFLLLDSEASDYSFSDWCDNFGFDSDSISAFNIYQQCENIAKQLKKVFSREQIKAMREALQDY